MEVVEDIPGCIVAPGLPRPDQGVDSLICGPIWALVKNLSSLNWLLYVACAKGPQTLQENKELPVLLQSCMDSRTILTRIGTPLDLGY